mmetsp:Transcript_33866/g.95907  ORF Transcript_33866/g.95907 Transcript_33866/m.95907 type:complete len:252 (-) Transcript_33866:2271-3026(-)
MLLRSGADRREMGTRGVGVGMTPCSSPMVKHNPGGLDSRMKGGAAIAAGERRRDARVSCSSPLQNPRIPFPAGEKQPENRRSGLGGTASSFRSFHVSNVFQVGSVCSLSGFPCLLQPLDLSSFSSRNGGLLHLALLFSACCKLCSEKLTSCLFLGGLLSSCLPPLSSKLGGCFRGGLNFLHLLLLSHSFQSSRLSQPLLFLLSPALLLVFHLPCAHGFRQPQVIRSIACLHTHRFWHCLLGRSVELLLNCR